MGDEIFCEYDCDWSFERGVHLVFGRSAKANAGQGAVGRTGEAQTDAMMHAEILAYSRSRGIFAGVSLGRRDACGRMAATMKRPAKR